MLSKGLYAIHRVIFYPKGYAQRLYEDIMLHRKTEGKVSVV